MSSEARFKEATANHEMHVFRDDGVYRHLQFRNPKCISYHFHIVTWPGYLTISGDMGCWTFSRVQDMFAFFRGEGINKRYWAEKCVSVSKFGGPIKEYSAEVARESLVNDIEQTFEEDPLSEEQVNDILEVLGVAGFSTTHEFYDALSDFSHQLEDGRTWAPHDEFWEIPCEDYSFHYVWILRAIVWGIAQYDKATGA